jgi:alkylglycerol monooxygenase
MQALQTTLLDIAVPIMVLLIGVEVFVAWRKGLRLHRLADGISSLATGVFMQLSGLFINLLTVSMFFWAASSYALTHLPDSSPISISGGIQVHGYQLLVWLICFLGVDFAFYWFHRAAHRVNLLWATHVVHHSSEDYNLFVGLRHGSIENIFSSFFYLPLAFLGFSFEMFLTCYSINLIWQFWVHTELVGHLGPLEYIFSTPRHHQVHHAVNPAYIDKNYGGTLIIWDRLFGTFEPLAESAVYGITTPVRRYDLLSLNFHGFADIAKAIRTMRSWGDRLRVLFLPPGWRPEYHGGTPTHKPVKRETFEKYNPEITLSHKVYVSVHFAIVLMANHFITQSAYEGTEWRYLVFWVMAVLLTLTSLGGMLQKSRWSMPMELARLTASLLISGFLLYTGYHFPGWKTAAALAGSVVSLVCLIVPTIKAQFEAHKEQDELFS